MKAKILTLTIAAALSSTWALAQDPGRPPRPPGPRDGDRPPGGDQRPLGPLPIPFLHALDTDDDGIISADEIKGAPDALKSLDKNHDGQLSRDEWQPQPPPPPQGERPAGARDGEQRKSGPRDGERARGGPRDGEAKAPEKKGNDWPFGKEKTATGNAASAGNEKPAGDAREKGDRPQGPPPPPLLEALDTDRDGKISADEIGKSPESLAKLDKNNDGQLGPREYGPRPPQEPPQGQAGQNGAKPEDKPGQ
jgi:hypothetical protein